ncbi:hypothetical protein FIBSPDRAFT_955631, partial [Athelia psychrophila]
MEIARDAERKPKEVPRATQSAPRNHDSRRLERPSGSAPGGSGRSQTRPSRGGGPNSGHSRPLHVPRGTDNSNQRQAYLPKQDSKNDQDRKKRLRDEGKCFLCESAQHLARDCPQSTQKKPPAGLHAMGLGMMSPAEIRLAALDEAERDALWEIVLTTIAQSLPFPWDELEESAGGVFATTRFNIVEYGGFDLYLIQDRHDGQEHTLYKSQLTDPNFDLITHLIQWKTEFYEGLAEYWNKNIPSTAAATETKLILSEGGLDTDSDVPPLLDTDSDSDWSDSDTESDISDVPSLEDSFKEDVPWALD